MGIFKWKLGSNFVSILRIVLSPKILLPFLSLALYASGIVYGAFSLGIWDLEILKDTLILFMLLGFPLMYRAATSRNGILLIREETARTLRISTFVAFYLNLATLSIPWEIFIQLVLVVTTISVLVPTDGNRNLDQAKALMNRITVTIGIFYLFFTPFYLLKNWNSVDLPHSAMSLGMSFWFPLALLPYIYLISVYSSMELALIRLRARAQPDQKPNFRVLLAVICGFRLNSRLAHKFDGSWSYRIRGLTKFREASQIMKEFRKSHKPN